MTDVNTETSRPIPPGITEADLGGALAAIARAIGEDKIAADAETIAEFSDPLQVPGSASNAPSGVASPATVEDVQAIVRLANEHHIPVWPVSRGKNNGYGGAAPQVRGSLMVSSRNMTENEEQVQAAYTHAKRMVATAGKLGYGEYRAHLSFMDLAADQFGFNDHAQRRFNEAIKDTLDPNGIIAPGKSGIRGTRYREAGFPRRSDDTTRRG